MLEHDLALGEPGQRAAVADHDDRQRSLDLPDRLGHLALGGRVDREVADAVEQLKGSLTIVVIGHRGALTELAERQVVLENGRVVSPA